MNIWPRHAQRELNQQGFTLLEVMVVIVIIGILFSMANLNVFQSSDRQLEEAARRFAGLVQLANEEAIINDTSYAVALSKDGYQFYLLDAAGKLQPIPEVDRAFRARSLPSYGRFVATIEGEEATLPASLVAAKESEDDESAAEEADNAPKIYFLSSGEMTPFEVSVESEDRHLFTVKGDFSGKVKYLGRTDK